jgi:hypothetical protein
MRPLNLSALALAAAIGLSIAAQAQTPPAPPPGADPGGGGWRHDGGPGRPGMGEHREARRAARLKALHDVLAIRPDQESAFQAFAQATTPEPGKHAWGAGRGGWKPGQGHEGDRAGAPSAAATTPERLDLMLQRFDERSAAMRAAIERRAMATKALYAALSPEQQRTLDALPTLIGRGPGGPEGLRGERPGLGAGGPGPGAPGGGSATGD